jgi:hypothetical protein
MDYQSEAKRPTLGSQRPPRTARTNRVPGRDPDTLQGNSGMPIPVCCSRSTRSGSTALTISANARSSTPHLCKICAQRRGLIRQPIHIADQIWRRERDSNPRYTFLGVCSLSRGVPSTTRPSLRLCSSHLTAIRASLALSRSGPPCASPRRPARRSLFARVAGSGDFTFQRSARSKKFAAESAN